MPGGRQVLGCSVCPTLQQRPARLSPDKDQVLSAPITGALEQGPRRKGQTLAHPREHLALPEPMPAPSPWNLPQKTTPSGVVSPTASTQFLFLSPQTLSPKDRGDLPKQHPGPRFPVCRIQTHKEKL